MNAFETFLCYLPLQECPKQNKWEGSEINFCYGYYTRTEEQNYHLKDKGVLICSHIFNKKRKL